MAVKLSRASGNWLTAGTWGVVDATSYNNNETTATALTTSYQASSGSTTGAITVDGVALKLSVRTGTTGTMSVHLAVAGVEVTGTLVTINTADLPVAATADLNGGWIFFKFASPVTLSAATSYTVEAKTSSSSQVSLRSTSGSNWARALVTTTTGAPAAGDDVIICGEYLSAGSSNSFTVTMDETGSTDYGAASTSLVTPAIAICNKGTLSFGSTSSTNYNLKVSGNVIVYSGGTFNIGTTGTPIPRTSTATLLFDCGSNVDFGLTVRNLGTFVSQGLSRTSGKDIVSCKLNTDEAVNSTSLGVDTDTGWLDNDEIAIAATTSTAAQCENGTLNGNASSTVLTVDGFAGAGGGLAFAHSGTSPIQAEVILLTRNVVIKGTSVTLQTYLNFKEASQVDMDWTECKWMGSSTTNKRGINCSVEGGSVNIQYCSLRNFEVSTSFGLTMNGATGSGLTFSNNVTYRIYSSHIQLTNTNAVSTLSNNIFMRNLTSGTMIDLPNTKGTITGNTIIGASATGLDLSESIAVLGTFTDNTIHSCAGLGLLISGRYIAGTLTNTKVWRNANSSGVGGISFTISQQDITFDTLTVFGNESANIVFGVGAFHSNVSFYNLVSNADTGNASAVKGIVVTDGNPTLLNLNIINGDFSSVSGIMTAHSIDIDLGSSNTGIAALNIVNTKLGGTTEIGNTSGMTPTSFVSSQKHDQTAGVHKTWKKYGLIQNETTTVHSGSNSMKMTPNNASNKLESSGVYGGFQVAVENGNTVTPSVYVYEDASYNGNRARLVLKRNDALGITSDTVIATATAASDAAWEELTGTTASVTDDGVLEFVIDCDGTAGNLFVDSFTA